MMRHINSVFRDLLDARTPFEMMKSEQEIKLLNLLELQPIPPDEVLLKPALLIH
jgi:hypothetical protein